MGNPDSVVEVWSAQEASDAVAGTRRAEQVWPARSSRSWRYALLRRMLACADLAAALVASSWLIVTGADGSQFAWSILFLPAWLLIAKLLGLYDRDGRSTRHGVAEEGAHLVLWAVLGAAFLSLYLVLTPTGHLDTSTAVEMGVLALASVFVLRPLARWLWRRITPVERVGIFGSEDGIRAVERKLQLFPELHGRVVALGGAADIELALRDPALLARIDRVFLAPGELDDMLIRSALVSARAADVSLTLVPPLRSVGSAAELRHIADLPLLDFRTSHVSRSTALLKRALDVVFSSVGLVVASPILLACAVAIKLDSRGPVFFTQLRAGRHGRPFRMVKLRSMVVDAEARLPDLISLESLPEPMFKLHADPRVTRVGRVLRRWSLDELPQLWNVLVGQMSLVGPRPEQLDLVERYTPEQRVRLSVAPGITGPMQVNGRGDLTLEERLAVERDYVENVSLARDLRILGQTIAAVFTGRGAY